MMQLGLCLAWIALVQPRRPDLWLVAALLVGAYFVSFIWRHVVDNHPAAVLALSPRLGAGTVVTLCRIACVTLLSGYSLAASTWRESWLLAALYGANGAGDWLDGFLARRSRHETRLGEQLDMRVDIVGMLVAPAAAVLLGRLPPWYLVLSVAPVFFYGGIKLRQILALPCYPARLRSSVHGRAFAGYHMVVIAAALVPVVRADVVWVVASVLMIPSLVAFGRDWLVVTGWLVPDSPSYQRAVGRLVTSVRQIAPTFFRPVFAGAVLLTLPGQTWVSALSVFSAFAVLIGWMPRVVVLAWLFVVSLSPSQSVHEASLVAVGSCLLLFGGGFGSLYQPEERWFFGRHGG